MTEFAIHNEKTAPQGSQSILADARKRMGFIPNVFGVLAEAPVAVEAYGVLNDLFVNSSFSPEERHVVWFANIFENDCTYCMAAHSGIAKLEKISDALVQATRAGDTYADPRLEALRTFTRSVVVNRGWVSDAELSTFLDAGFNRQHVMEILVGVAHKVISTYANHIANTPLDSSFARMAWEKPAPIAQAG